ncbi:MAG: hypothetical protein JW706_06730, partial [Opitutales bacterium]|nr:hypothetical protein [Opitutales bacterium]
MSPLPIIITFAILLMAGSWFGGGCHANPSREADALNVSTFREIWNTIETSFPATPEQREKWQAIRQSYASRIEGAEDHAVFRSLAHDMIAEMGLSHFNVLESDPLSDLDRPLTSGNTGFLGLELTYAHHHWWITQVHPGSPAQEAGMQPGFRIRSVDGIIPDNRDLPAAARFRQSRWVWGPSGTHIALEFLDRKDGLHKKTLEYREWKGFTSTPIGVTGEVPILYQESVLDGAMVVRFSNWYPVILPTLVKAIRAASDYQGLIIDLRSNTGGIGMMANGVAGRMSDRAFSLGTLHMSQGTLNFAVFPQTESYLGKVAILIDGWSASTSEIFAQGMKEAGRARVFGSRSMGAALPSFFKILPNGDTLQYAIATYESPSGIAIEGSGVIPDQPVEAQPEDLLHG